MQLQSYHHELAFPCSVQESLVGLPPSWASFHTFADLVYLVSSILQDTALELQTKLDNTYTGKAVGMIGRGSEEERRLASATGLNCRWDTSLLE